MKLVLIVTLLLAGLPEGRATTATQPNACLTPVGVRLITFPSATIQPLPAPFAALFECAPCCDEAIRVYTGCKRLRKADCECIGMAYNHCLDAGCGPCACCADWDEVGQAGQCW